VALSDGEIGLLVEKYGRERDRYQKMAALVQRYLQAALRDQHIRCVVTSRAKDGESLGDKLRKDRADLSYGELQYEFNPAVIDVAGARVMLYEFERDNDRVIRLVDEIFEVAPDPRFRKDKGLKDTRIYQARHRVVRLRQEQLNDPTHENLKNLLCELQVVSLVKHTWNELEHDVRYKDPEGLGKPDAEQQAWLDVLWDSLQAAETAVGHLSRVTDRKRAVKLDASSPIQNTEELRLTLGLLLGRPLNGDVSALFRLLNGTEQALSRSSLEGMGLASENVLEVGRAFVGERLADPDDVESIVAFLCKDRGPDFLDLASSWRGRETRIRRLIESLVRSEGDGT
jgi:ppGpp synthetase/RelA/SpoT-type nucleotidyltranferase